MAYPQIKKLAADESNIELLIYKSKQRFRKVNKLDKKDLYGFVEDVVRESYTHGAASHDMSIDKA